MDTRTSPRCEPHRPALSQRSERRRVGHCRTNDSPGEAWRTQTVGERARGSERDLLLLWTGCQWKALPKDLPPKSTVHDYLELWNWDGTLERIHHALYIAVREQEGREASPTAAVIDSQTAKGAQKGGLRSILRATTRARRSKAASGTSWSTRWASC